MEITNYAPVVIPTLNRYKHFERCLESLENCTDADKTVVYVALDYPPSEKYKKGWALIDSYLAKKEISNRFKELIVIRRSSNCGIGHDKSNVRLLHEEVMQRFDRYISTEDDNEFSPNFLQYMNWGLKTYAKDNSVYAICGYKELEIPSIKNNVYSYYRFNAWGYGRWYDRPNKAREFRNREKLIEHAKQIPISVIFDSDELLHAYHVLRMIHRNVYYGDSLRGCLPKEERMCIFPAISKVRNHGLDGSGQHGKGSTKRIEQTSLLKIDESTVFEPIVVEPLYQEFIHETYKNFYKLEIGKHAKCACAFLLWKICRINIC